MKFYTLSNAFEEKKDLTFCTSLGYVVGTLEITKSHLP